MFKIISVIALAFEVILSVYIAVNSKTAIAGAQKISFGGQEQSKIISAMNLRYMLNREIASDRNFCELVNVFYI
jgi:hypothetical protein